MAEFVRRDIWTLEEEAGGPWHPIMLAYALGVGVMQSRPPTEVTSWAYQAEVHGMRVQSAPDAFRHQCQHRTWYFLPWHRIYLHYFERIVRAALDEVPELPDDVNEVKGSWALPYWDYSRGEDSRMLPRAFREEKLPGTGDDNPLHTELRNANLMRGGRLTREFTLIAAALSEPFFAARALPGRTAAFGGAMTRKNHGGDPEGAPGALENTPHNVIHGEVGLAPGGLMRDVSLAALDPVFWVHHSNIDRVWVEWLEQGGRSNPAETAWLDLRFDFHDETGAEVQKSAAEVVDIEALGYEYEAVERVALLADEGRPLVPSEPPPDHPPELVGATAEPLTLSGHPERVAIPVEEPVSPALASDSGAAEPERVYLNVEGVVGDENPGLSYAVHVNLPDDADERTRDSYHVGNVSFFGIELTQNVETDHPAGPGLRFAFDMTELVRQLREQGRWDPERVTVSFTPMQPEPAPGEEDASEPVESLPPVTIGRVGIYYQ